MAQETNTEQENTVDIDDVNNNFYMKKIYRELFKDYILSEGEKNDEEKTKNLLHPHSFYFLDFLPDQELENIFGVRLLTFSNNDSKYKAYKEEIGTFKDYEASDLITPISKKNKKKTYFNSPVNFALDYDFDIEAGTTSDITLQLFNREILLPLTVIKDNKSDFLPKWEADVIDIDASQHVTTAYNFINRVHERILRIFKLIISMKNNKLEMTDTLNNFLNSSKFDKDTKKEITTWNQLKKVILDIDKDPINDEVKESHKKYKLLTKKNMEKLLSDEPDIKKNYNEIKKKHKSLRLEGKDIDDEEKKVMDKIKNIKKIKSNKSYIGNIRFKQFQHELFITINYVNKIVEWIKDLFNKNSETIRNSEATSNFFVDYLETITKQLELLFKTIDDEKDMKNLIIRVLNTRVEYFDDINVPFISRVSFEIYNPKLTLIRAKDVNNKLNSGSSKAANSTVGFTEEDKKKIRDKYGSLNNLIKTIEEGKSDDLPKDNSKRVAYNEITSKDISVAEELYKETDLSTSNSEENERKKKILKDTYNKKILLESGSKNTTNTIKMQDDLEKYSSLNLTFDIKTPILPFYANVGHISLPKDEQQEPIIENGKEFNGKWKSRINTQGKNYGAVSTVKYAIYKNRDKNNNFAPIVEPMKESGQKLNQENRYFSKEIDTKQEEKKNSEFENYMKTTSNKSDISTKDGMVLTLIDRNTLNYDTKMQDDGLAGYLKFNALSSLQTTSEYVTGSSTIYSTFHNRLFNPMITNKDYIEHFKDKLVPDKTTNGRICHKKAASGNKKQLPISDDDIENFYFCAFITGLKYEDDNDELLKSIDKQAVSLYELENCVDPLEIESLSDDEKIKRKSECWTKHDALSVYTFGHFSRLPYTSRNILQKYTTTEKIKQEGGKNMEMPILDLFTAWYNIVPWISGFSSTIPGSSVTGASRLPRIPYHIDEEFSESRDGNIRVYNFLNQNLYVFYRDEFYEAYWLRRDLNYNNTYFDGQDINTVINSKYDNCIKGNKPVNCPEPRQKGGDEKTEEEEVSKVLNPKPIRPKISYGKTIPLEFRDKQLEPDEEPKVIQYDDPSIDLIPKIILRRDKVIDFKEMDSVNYKYESVKLISEYIKKFDSSDKYGNDADEFANDFINFLHVIGIKKINYNVYNDKEGNLECKSREDEKEQFYGKTKIGDKIINTVSQITDDVAGAMNQLENMVISDNNNNKDKINSMQKVIKEKFSEIQSKQNTKNDGNNEEKMKNMEKTAKDKISEIQNKQKVEQMVTTGKTKMNQIKGFSNLINQSKTTMNNIKEKIITEQKLQSGGDEKKTLTPEQGKIKREKEKQERELITDNELCLRYDHTNIRTAMFASKWNNKGYALNFMKPNDKFVENEKITEDPYLIQTEEKTPEKYYEKSYTNAVDIIITKDDLTTEIVYNLKYSEVDSNKQKITAGEVVGDFSERISYSDLVENKHGEVEKITDIIVKHIKSNANTELQVHQIEQESTEGTLYRLIEDLARNIKFEDFLTEPKYDFMQSIERLMFRVENNPIKVSMLKALGLDFESKKRKSRKEREKLFKELLEREKAARAMKNTMLVIAAYLVSNKLYTENVENQINAMLFNAKAHMDVLKFQTGNDSVIVENDEPEQQGGYNYRNKKMSVSKLLDDVSEIERILSIDRGNRKNKNSANKSQNGGSSVNLLTDFKQLTKLMYDCTNNKTSNAKKKSIQEFIENRYPKDMAEQDSEIAKLYKDCQPQEGGAVRIGGIDLDVKDAKSNIINLQKIGGIENLVGNPYYIPHHMDPYIADHHFSFTQPCPEGYGATICSIFASLAGRSTKGGGKMIEGGASTLDRAKGSMQRMGQGINKKLGLDKKAKTAAKRFGSVLKSPESATRVTAGVKNTRNALLNNGVVRAVKERGINPNNIPYIMNEGKLKNYLQLMQWYFMGDMLLDDEQIFDNMTVRPGRMRKTDKVTGKAIYFNDANKRENTGISLNVDPGIEKRSYMPRIVNSRRLIAGANNVVLGNMSDKHLSNPDYNKVHRGNYGKLAPKKGDDLALAFWLGFR